jgi:hypothetical protein
MQSDVIDYLSLGFVPNADVSLRYLTELSEKAQEAVASDPGIVTRGPGELLTSIVEEKLSSTRGGGGRDPADGGA